MGEVEVPLLLFGVSITLLVMIGVVLAIQEFRQSHAPRERPGAAEYPTQSSG